MCGSRSSEETSKPLISEEDDEDSNGVSEASNEGDVDPFTVSENEDEDDANKNLALDQLDSFISSLDAGVKRKADDADTIQNVKALSIKKRRYTVEQLIEFLRTKNIDESKIKSLLDNEINEELLEEIVKSLNLGDTLFKKLESEQEFAVVRHEKATVEIEGSGGNSELSSHEKVRTNILRGT